MTLHSLKFFVNNRRAAAHIVTVEPWGEDFTLLTGEEIEINAFSEDAASWFQLVEWEGASQVYCENAVTFKVMQGGVQLKCGHNRQLASKE